jgi:predicted permease
MRLLASSLGAVIPFGVVMTTDIDIRVLTAMLMFSVVSTLLFGFGPAWKCSRPNVVQDLKDHAGTDLRGSRRLVSTRNLLVMGQLSLSLALLAAGGLFARGAWEAAGLDAGFDMDNGILVELDAGMIGYDEIQGRELYADLNERLQTLPGIEWSDTAATIPFGMVRMGERVRRAGATDSEPQGEVTSVSAGFNSIGADYFRALDVPILRGRPFTPTEATSDSAPPVAIINEELARRLFPDEEPLGQQIQYGRADTEKGEIVWEVVGVVPTLQANLIPSTPEPYIYVPFGREYRSNIHIHLRTSIQDRDAEANLLQAVRREIRSADERLPILMLKNFRHHFDTSTELWLVKLGARLFSLFGTLALFLAAGGVYGVRAYMVAQRTREIGIRTALGATSRDAIQLVLREGLVLTLWGIGFGLVLAYMAGQVLSSMLYRVSATDPAVFLGAPLVLALISLLACYIPARRAATVNVMDALHYE